MELGTCSSSCSSNNTNKNKVLNGRSIELISKVEDSSIHSLEIEEVEGVRKGSLLTPSGAAVVIRNGGKSYKAGQPVLDGLDMTVPCGSIYGLLGSSGCGKTTILSCIIGVRQLDYGNIWVFGRKAGTTRSIGVPGKNVGYMPQETALYKEFTVKETLAYFGTLCGMTLNDIQRAIAMLVKLLDLPQDSRQVGVLSCGKQRRVSFATALIHSPELLILDEPTVGVDAILREKIWAYLGELIATKRTTIIITTHYLEEAKNANNVGVVRNGQILAEGPPAQLMTDYGGRSLEEVVLMLCKTQDKKMDGSRTRMIQGAESDINSNFPDVPMASILKGTEVKFSDKFARIRALTVKNFVLIIRNIFLLFFVVIIAALLVIILCVGLGGDPSNLPLGIVNHEVNYDTVCSNISRIEGECNVENLSCDYLSHISTDTVNLRSYGTEGEALAATKEGTLWGYLLFPAEFSTFLYTRGTSGSTVGDDILNGSTIIVRLDHTNKQIALRLRKVLFDAYEDFITAFLSNCGFDPRQGEALLKYKTPVFGKDDTDFREYIGPSFGPAIICFFTIVTSASRYIREKKSGMLERCLVLGVKSSDILIAYSISEFCILSVQSLLILFTLHVIFQIPVMGSVPLLFSLIFLFGYGGIAMGFFLGTICSDEIQAAMVAMAAFFPNLIMSGIVWPLEGVMPIGLQYLAKAFPCTLPAEAVRSIVSRGWEFSHPNVWPGFAVAAAYVCIYFSFTIIFHTFIKR